MIRVLIAIIALATLSGLSLAANLTGPVGGWSNKTLTGPIQRNGTVTPPVSGSLLLEDGSSFLLLEDGTSQLCLEGGC